MKKRILILFLGLCAALLALPMAAYAAPSINQEPQSASYEVGSEATPLVVVVEDEGEPLAYQWYSNTTDSTDSGTSIEGETDASYTPPTDREGITWYYCIVTTDGQNGPESVTTSTARIEVATHYNVWVAGTQVSSLNADDVLGSADEGATVVYDAETSTLTLDGASIEMTDGRYAIYAGQDLALELSGTNSVTLSGTSPIEGREWSDVDIAPNVTAAIACKGSLTVKSGDGGQGTLTASIDAAIYCGPEKIDSYLVGGIVATGTVSIEDAEVEATSANSYAYTKYDGVTDASLGILAGEGLTVSDASVDASSGEASRSAGIIAPTGDINLNGNIVAAGNGTSDQLYVDFEFSAGIYAYDGTVSITGGSVDAHAADHSKHSEAYGICGASGVSITGGKVVAAGTESNVDAIEPEASLGICSTEGDVVISGKDTSVEANGGFARYATIGIGAQSGNVLIADATVKAAAQNEPGNEDGIAVGIFAYQIIQPMSMTSRSGSDTGNITLTGADVQVVGTTAPVSFTGSLTVAPAEGMRYAVDALDKMIVEYPGLSWDEMAANAKGIEGSPFAEKTSIDNELVAGQEYLHFYNVAAEAEPETPEEPTDPVVPEEPSKPNEPTETPDEDTDAVIPKTGDFGAIAPLAAAICSALAIGAGMAIRQKNR